MESGVAEAGLQKRDFGGRVEMAGLQKTGCEGGLRRRRLDDRALLQSMVAIKTLNGKSKLLKNIGGMAEWSMAAVLKTVDPQGSGGSNPSSSAE